MGGVAGEGFLATGKGISGAGKGMFGAGKVFVLVCGGFSGQNLFRRDFIPELSIIPGQILVALENILISAA